MSQVHASRSIEIARPVDEVYDVVVDPANDPRWCRMVVSSQLVDGTPGRPGARYRQVQRPGPVGRRIELELLEVARPGHVRLRWSTAVATFDCAYHLEDRGNTTRMTHTSTVALRGAGRLARPMVGAAMPRSMEQQLTALADLLGRGAGVRE